MIAPPTVNGDAPTINWIKYGHIRGHPEDSDEESK